MLAIVATCLYFFVPESADGVEVEESDAIFGTISKVAGEKVPGLLAVEVTADHVADTFGAFFPTNGNLHPSVGDDVRCLFIETPVTNKTVAPPGRAHVCELIEEVTERDLPDLIGR